MHKKYFFIIFFKYGPIHDVLKGGISCLGTSSGSFPGNAGTRQPEQEQEPTHQCASFVNLLAIVNLSQLSFCFIYVDVTDCRRSQCKRFVCLWLFSSAHNTPPGARLFLGRSVKLYLSFINVIKRRMQYYSIGTHEIDRNCMSALTEIIILYYIILLIMAEHCWIKETNCTGNTLWIINIIECLMCPEVIITKNKSEII